ncbi:hypothetical protein [Spongiactinospora sp. 9N601]|uniref:hypothetical protein n=1 Tax=Spongiactinospora sp. 9N601 TaxID=3375149 RepID=UPI00379C63F8
MTVTTGYMAARDKLAVAVSGCGEVQDAPEAFEQTVVEPHEMTAPGRTNSRCTARS